MMWRSEPFDPVAAGYYSLIIEDFMAKHPPLMAYAPANQQSLNERILEKKRRPVPREVLVEVLFEQYQDLEKSSVLQKNIELLLDDETFTVTTGHQLNIFSGPLFTWYKLIDTISLAKKYEKELGKKVVPVFWMATEDHDLDEISQLTVHGQYISWTHQSNGPAGDVATDSLREVIEKSLYPLCKEQKHSLEKWTFWYEKEKTLAGATRGFWNEIFGNEGLVIIDASHQSLKKIFIPWIEKELFDKEWKKPLWEQCENLSKNYSLQVNPREINLFLIQPGYRERIVPDGTGYKTADEAFHWGAEQLKQLIHDAPEFFSPNVVMRPLYQEVLLPNLAVVGGPGEISYWLQLSGMFNAADIPFPFLQLRTSVIIADSEIIRRKKHIQKDWSFLLQKLEIQQKQQLQEDHAVFSLAEEISAINQWKTDWDENIQKYNSTLLPKSIKAHHAIIKALRRLERSINQHKMDHGDEKQQTIKSIHQRLFPGGQPQERVDNFLSYSNFPPAAEWIRLFMENSSQGIVVIEE